MSSTVILKYSDNKFLCNQYVDEICKNKNLNKVYITTIEDAIEDYFGNNDTLYVIDVENFKEYPTEDYKNLVIICKSVPENLTIDFTDMTKLLNWQIEDYVKYRVPGLEENENENILPGLEEKETIVLPEVEETEEQINNTYTNNMNSTYENNTSTM